MNYTIQNVSDRIGELCAIPAAELRAMKPAERRQRASHLADLYEIRAQLFAELDLATAVLPGAVKDVAMGMARAADNDKDSVKFWRHEAGAK